MQIFDRRTVALPGPAADASPTLIAAAEAKAAQAATAGVAAADIPGKVTAAVAAQNIPGQVTAASTTVAQAAAATYLGTQPGVAAAAAAAVRGALDVSPLVPQAAVDEEVAWAPLDEAGNRGWAQVRRGDGRATGPTRRYLRRVVASDLAVYGDSIMYNVNKGVTIPRVLAGLLGGALHVPTAAGWGALEAGLVAGAIRPTVTLAGGVIPAASVEVAATLSWTAGGWSQWLDVDIPFRVAGVDGSLRYTRSTGALRWQRWEAGNAVPIPTGAIGYVIDAGPHRRDITVIAHGRNSTDNPSAIAAVDAAIVNHIAHTAYAVLDVLPTRGESTGSAGRATVDAINATRAATYGAHFIPVWAWVRTNARAIVEAAGLTWTSTDQADLDAGCLATSLRLPGDDLHPNEIANLAAAPRIHSQMLARKIIEE